MKEFHKKFDVAPFGYHVHVVLSDDVPASIKKRERTIGRRNLGGNVEAVTWVRAGCSDVWVFLPFPCTVNALTHETYHAVRFILRDIGDEHQDEEIVAYHLGDLTSRITDFAYEREVWEHHQKMKEVAA